MHFARALKPWGEDWEGFTIMVNGNQTKSGYLPAFCRMLKPR